MKQVYIETSIISFLTARPSANMHAESRRQITLDWWHKHRSLYQLFASPLVVVDYLLTWNCRHIDNAVRKPLIRQLCKEFGYTCAEICTPEELMEV